MPRFYFDTRDGEFIRDDEGLELASIEDAQAEATTTLGGYAKDALSKGVGRDREISIEVLDENRKPLLRAALWFEVQNLV